MRKAMTILFVIMILCIGTAIAESSAAQRIYILDQNSSGSHSTGYDIGITHKGTQYYNSKDGSKRKTMSSHGCSLYATIHAFQWLTGYSVSDSNVADTIRMFLQDANGGPEVLDWKNIENGHSTGIDFLKTKGVSTTSVSSSNKGQLANLFNQGGVAKYSYSYGNSSHFALAVGMIDDDLDGDGAVETWIHIVDSAAYFSFGTLNMGWACRSFSSHRQLSLSELSFNNNRSENNYSGLEYWMRYDLFKNCTISYGLLPTNDIESPVITSARITNATPNSYTVVCEARDNYGVSRLRIGTWSDVIGIDAAHWDELPAVNGTATFTIDITDYGNVQNTTYHTNVYAIDGRGNVSEGVRAGDIVLETTPPTVTMARIDNITPFGYDVVCKASDNVSISQIMIGTWHSKMSIDDAVWQGVSSDGSTTIIHVDIKDFNYVQDATYHTNVYAFDQCGNVSDVVRAGDPFIENNGPKIVSARIHDASPTGYSVTCSADSSTDIVKLRIGTWHSKMSIDDAQWQEMNAATGTFYISISDFGNVQNAVYHTNVFAFDSLGRSSEAVRVGDIMLETTPPEVTEAYIDNVTSTGYDVVCKASDNYSIKRIRIGTWHSQMSIDDAVWQDVESDGQTTTIHVDIIDFNNAQNVTYHTNVYAFDQCGNVSDVKRAGDVLIVDIPEPIEMIVTPSDALLSLLSIDNKQDLEEQTAYYSAHIREHLTVEVTFNDGSVHEVDDYGVTTWVEHDDSKPLKYGFDYTVSYGDLIDTTEISITLNPDPVFGIPDFTLPSALTIIDESAFEGIAASVVYVPDTCTGIGRWAFRNCPNLTQIRIPANCSIGTDAFDGCDDVVIFGTKGSAAETYANNHENCTFVAE